MPQRPAPFGSTMFVDAREIACLLGCSAKHVCRLAKQGRLPKPVRIGRLLRWSREVIEQWLEDKT